jgi:photosystem I subunit X
MLYSAILLAAAPMSQAWSPTTAIVMAVCNLLGVVAATKAKKVGPMLGPLSAGQFVGGTCFGHLLGAGAILGLTGVGAI